jgi:hypothetical protein
VQLFSRGLAVVLLLATCVVRTAAAGPVEEARGLYDRFVSAQNAGDFAALETVLLDSPRFLWVTNGLAIWGRDAAIARMKSYHTAEVWRIEADNAHAVAVEIGAATAMLNVPLRLTIGDRDGPDHFNFIVTALCAETDVGWRIAALLTTLANPDQP